MTGTARPLFVAVLLAAVVAANVGIRLAVAAATEGRDRAVDRREEAARQRASHESLAAAMGAQMDHDRRAVDEAAVSLDHLLAATTDVTIESAVIQSALDAATADLAVAVSRLDVARSITLTSASQRADVSACLDGIAAATVASRAGDVPAVVWIMQSVADQCRRARAALGAGGRFPYDFPDPYVLATTDGYVAYATNSAGGAVQVLRSTDLVDWSFAGVALPAVAPWAIPGATWAPSVLPRPGGFVLFYTVRHRDSGRQCISVATSASPTGPFSDTSAAPLVCEIGEGGSIDPSPVVAPDGSAYLLWKAEGETAGGRAALRARRLAADGLSLTGPVATLLGVDQPWEGRTVEGPTMAAADGSFVLLYSANRWDSSRYAVGAARCDTPLGPCRKLPGPVLATSGPMTGPGGAELFVDHDGRLRVAFHSWNGDAVGYPDNRYLHLGTATVTGDGVTVAVD
jgi:hypothetical protein